MGFNQCLHCGTERTCAVAAIAQAEVLCACSDVVLVARWISSDRSFDCFGLDCKEFPGAKIDQIALELIQVSWLRPHLLWHEQSGCNEGRRMSPGRHR